jgi:hypothetical protein
VALCFNVWAEGWQHFAHDMHPPAAGTPRAFWLMATRIDKLLMLQLLYEAPTWDMQQTYIMMKRRIICSLLKGMRSEEHTEGLLHVGLWCW